MSSEPAEEHENETAKLKDRIAELEDSMSEVLEILDGMKKSLARLEDKVATKKQVKKLKKVLDQLDVIEVGPEDAPSPEGSPSGN